MLCRAITVSLPHRSPAYSPSSPAACGSVATWLSFADRLPIASRQYARRYELLFGRRLARGAPKPNPAPPYAVFANVRPSASIPFEPAALPEALVVDGRAAACVCGLRGGGGRDSIVARARGVGPGTYDAPGPSRRRHGDGSKAVMSLYSGSISSSFAPPQESGLQSYELRRRRASLILAEQLRGGLDALQRRRRPDACGSLLAVASRVRAIRSSA